VIMTTPAQGNNACWWSMASLHLCWRRQQWPTSLTWQGFLQLLRCSLPWVLSVSWQAARGTGLHMLIWQTLQGPCNPSFGMFINRQPTELLSNIITFIVGLGPSISPILPNLVSHAQLHACFAAAVAAACLAK
jgi:hypothetical protein